MGHYPKFGELLTPYLTKDERSAAWVARQLKVKPSTVSRWQAGETRPATPELLKELCDVLRVPTDERSALFVAVGYGLSSPVGPAPAQEWRYQAKAGICTIALSPDGTHIVVGALDNSVIWLEADGSCRWVKRVGNQAARIAMDAQAELIVVGTNSTRPWDMGGRGIYAFGIDATLHWSVRLAASVWGLDVSLDGSTVAIGTDANQLLLFDRQGKQLWQHKLEGRLLQGWVWDTALSAQGQFVVAGSADTRIWLLDRGGRVVAKRQAEGDVFAVDISADGEFVGAGDKQGIVYGFDHTQESHWQYPLGDTVWALRVDTAGQRLLAGTGKKDGQLYLFNRSGQPLWHHYLGDGISCLAWSADGERVAAGTDNGNIYLLDEGGTLLHAAQAHAKIRDIALSANGELLVAGSMDGFVYGFQLQRP